MRTHRRLALPALVVLLLAAAAAAQELRARVTYVAADGVYVDAGTDAGLGVGDRGVVLRDGREIATAQVAAAAGRSARLTLEGRPEIEPQPGDEVVFEITAAAPKPEAEDGDVSEETKRAGEAEPFVPLLERNKRLAEARSRRNVAHGSVSLRTTALAVAEEVDHYVRTRLSSTGAVERFLGRRWALRWSGTLSTRTGDAFDGTMFDDVRLDVFELSLDMLVGDDGRVRAGRFLPRALPSAGYLDGALYEKTLGRTRVGGALGFRPARDDLSPTTDEPTALAFATLEAGERGGRHYSGTWGVLATWFDGDFDRLALLGDQHVSLEDRLFVDVSFEVDLDTGAALFREGTRLTRLDVHLRGRVTDGLTLRAGADHWERPDNAAERAALAPADAALFDSGFWRSFVGARQELGGHWSVDLELVFFAGSDSGDDPRWRASVHRRGLLGIASASATLTVYRLAGVDVDGVGGLLSAWIPLSGGRWTLQPSLGFRTFDESGADAADVRVFVRYRANEHWSFEAGVTQVLGDFDDTTTVDVGLRYRW